MGLIELILLLAFVGFALWLVRLLPLDATIKTLISGLVVFAVVIILLRSVLGSFNFRLW